MAQEDQGSGWLQALGLSVKNSEALATVDRVAGLSLPVWVRTCFCRSPEVLKALLHSSSGHLYGFSPV